MSKFIFIPLSAIKSPFILYFALTFTLTSAWPRQTGYVTDLDLWTTYAGTPSLGTVHSNKNELR